MLNHTFVVVIPVVGMPSGELSYDKLTTSFMSNLPNLICDN